MAVKKGVICLLMVFSVLSGGYAFAVELFINSDPLGAEVYLEGESIGKTPLRLVNPERDVLNLSIVKNGFQSLQDEVKLEGNERSKLLFYKLLPITIDFTIYQENRDVYINGVLAGKSPLIIKNLQPGTYDISNKDTTIYLSSGAYSKLKKTTIYESLFATGLFIASIAGTITIDRNDASPMEYALRISPFIAGGILAYDILKLCKLRTEIRRDQKTLKGIEVVPWGGEVDRDLFANGVELIGEESWEKAIREFMLLVNMYPDSRYVPLSIYEIGYSYYHQNEYQKAIEYFGKFLYQYPVYEFFSYGVYYLMETYRKLDNHQEALRIYDNLKPLYLDDVTGEVYKLYYNLVTDLYENTGRKEVLLLKDFLGELDHFVKQYKDSLYYPDILLLKGKLQYYYLDREMGVDIFNEIGENYNYRKELLLEIEAILRGK
ncbi:MAG: PEGA domain-containing protein [Spirochaetota bacterium]